MLLASMELLVCFDAVLDCPTELLTLELLGILPSYDSGF